MNWIKSHRRMLGIIAALVLILVVGGFAFTRGYFMRFVVNGSDISRDEFFSRAEASLTDNSVQLFCAQGDWTLGLGYIYEVHCFDTQDAVNAYMTEHFGSS